MNHRESHAADEGALLERAVAGDADALSALLQSHGPAIEPDLRISPSWRTVLDPADVMQVTYLEAFLRIGSFEPGRGTSFRRWLRRIAEHNLLDAIRGLERQKRPHPHNQVRALSYEDSLTGLYQLLGATSATPSREAATREALEQLEAAVRELPERYAQVVRLYDLENRSIEDVAAQLGRSPGAVHMLRARAHERLALACATRPG